MADNCRVGLRIGYCPVQADDVLWIVISEVNPQQFLVAKTATLLPFNALFQYPSFSENISGTLYGLQL